VLIVDTGVNLEDEAWLSEAIADVDQLASGWYG
jgi:hypothetical protein